MKLFNFLFIFASVIGLAYCDGSTNYELTYYGQKGEEHTKQNPSCPQYNDDNLPRYFAALGKRLNHYKDYCDNYAVFMSSDGSNVKTIAKAMIVDSCRECGAYHLDVSLNAFTKIVEKKKGEARIIWGVYSKSGKEVAGPWYDSVSGTAKKLGLSSSAFVKAFSANAKKLAGSSHYDGEFSTSGVSYHEEKEETTTKKTTTTTRKTTSRRTISKTTKKTTSERPKVTFSHRPFPVDKKPVTTSKKPFPLANSSSTQTQAAKVPAKTPVAQNPVAGTPVTQAQAPVAKAPVVEKPAAEKPAAPAPVSPAPAQQKDDNKKNEDDGIDALSVLAIGGGAIGAAGVGLLLMKKKSPSTYEGMKQKFPEAFTTIKRGISRRATSFKRNRNEISHPNNFMSV